ncbi:MAG TPA: hypothetical protein VJT73_18630 [Polyangiaceae bacterium]|nr:hypothetical protein [Polyangiaceae bacterium]
MSTFSSRSLLALLVVPMALAACGTKGDSATPDYDGLRREDDSKHATYPQPEAGATEEWKSLAPAPGAALNVGVKPAVPVMIVDAGSDVQSPVDSGHAVDSGLNLDALFSQYLYVSSSTNPAASQFVSDPSASAARVGTPFVIRSSYSALTFTWSAPNLNAMGYAVQFGSERYFYVRNASAPGNSAGNGSMSMYMSSSVCSYLPPSACHPTTMNLYLVTSQEAGAPGGLSTPLSIPVFIDCGGCL